MRRTPQKSGPQFRPSVFLRFCPIKEYEKTGNLIALIDVTDEDNLMIINRSGLTIRLEVSSLRVMGRNTQGVKLINLRNEDSIAAVAKVSAAKEEENSEVVAEEERGEAEPNGQSEENV